jgi:hypothetical protein
MNLFGDVTYMGLVVNDTEAAKKAWESRERAKEKGAGEAAAVVSKPIDLPGNLGIERKDMPQIARKDQKEFIKWARRQGITINPEQAFTSLLKPTQTQYDQARVDAMTPEIWEHKQDKPVLVSSDNRVLDGTHHWKKHEQEGNVRMPTMKIDLPARQAIALMNRFPKTEHRGIAFTGNALFAHWQRQLDDYLLYNAQPDPDQDDDEDDDEDEEDLEWATDDED